MVYAKFGGQTECIMRNSKIENGPVRTDQLSLVFAREQPEFHSFTFHSDWHFQNLFEHYEISGDMTQNIWRHDYKFLAT